MLPLLAPQLEGLVATALLIFGVGFTVTFTVAGAEGQLPSVVIRVY